MSVKMNKISALSLLLWASIGLNHPTFAQISENPLKLSSHHQFAQAAHYSAQTVVLGKAISSNEFRKITEYSNSKAIQNPIDFCIGILDDEEKAMSLEGLNYRQYQNQYAIEQIIFLGKTQNFKVAYGSGTLNRNTTTHQIKKLKAEIQKNTEKGQLVDRFSHQKYPYSLSYRIRKLDQDDLIYAYFDVQKLIGLQYVVQC